MSNFDFAQYHKLITSSPLSEACKKILDNGSSLTFLLEIGKLLKFREEELIKAEDYLCRYTNLALAHKKRIQEKYQEIEDKTAENHLKEAELLKEEKLLKEKQLLFEEKVANQQKQQNKQNQQKQSSDGEEDPSINNEKTVLNEYLETQRQKIEKEKLELDLERDKFIQEQLEFDDRKRKLIHDENVFFNTNPEKRSRKKVERMDVDGKKKSYVVPPKIVMNSEEAVSTLLSLGGLEEIPYKDEPLVKKRKVYIVKDSDDDSDY